MSVTLEKIAAWIPRYDYERPLHPVIADVRRELAGAYDHLVAANGPWIAEKGSMTQWAALTPTARAIDHRVTSLRRSRAAAKDIDWCGHGLDAVIQHRRPGSFLRAHEARRLAAAMWAYRTPGPQTIADHMASHGLSFGAMPSLMEFLRVRGSEKYWPMTWRGGTWRNV